MPDSYVVMITDPARADLREIADYICRDSPQNAAAVSEALLRTIDSLDVMPDRFKRVGVSRGNKTPVHAVTVSSFIIYYRIDAIPRSIHILRVLRGARRQPRRFN